MDPARDDASLLLTALHAGRMNSFDWDVVTDRVTRIGGIRQFLGVDAELGATGREFFALVHPGDREAMRAALDQLTPEAPDFAYEYRLLLPGRVVRWIRDSGRAEFGDDRSIVRLRGVAMDVTQRREAEARVALVAAISELIGAFDDPGELLYETSHLLGEHLDARRCLFTEIDTEADRGLVRRDYCRGVPSVAGLYKLSDYAESTRREMQAGRIVVNADSKADPRTAANYERTYEPNGERAYVAVPLLREGRWVGALWISDDVPRQWTEQEVALLQSAAERVWTAVEKLRVLTALRDSESRLHFVGERANVGHWYWDIVTDTLSWSTLCKQMFDIDDAGDITYARFLETLHPDDRATADRAVKVALAGGGDYDVEYRAVLRDGSLRWIQARGSAMFEGGVAVRMAGIVLDVTPRKALEHEREDLLARERRLRAQADEANLAKDHFLALLSHELRTPMTTILGWASFLGSGMGEPELIPKGIESIEQASRVQARLIDDLLDVSRIVTGKLTLERKVFDLMDAVRAAVALVERGAHAHALELTVDGASGPAFVEGDPLRIQQIVSNLLSNAMKFTPERGRVDVTVRELAESLELRVRDDGIGIEPEFLPHVFDRFRQAEDGPSRRFGGLGIGLSIVKTLAELHGGSIAAASEGRGRGAEFTVRLPRAAIAVPQDAASRDAALAPAALADVRVLVVEDDEASRDVLAAMLASFGARVMRAASVADAMHMLEEARPDVIVSDIGMAGENGYDLIRQLRASAEFAQLPAIAVTAYADPADRVRALGAGFQDYLAKPVERGALAAAVLAIARAPMQVNSRTARTS